MKGDPRIVAALDQIENGIRAIDSIMKDREDAEDALDGDSDERF